MSDKTKPKWLTYNCIHCQGSGKKRVLNGLWIRQRRKRKGRGLRELARLVKISAAYLYDIELSRRDPSHEVATRISDALR